MVHSIEHAFKKEFEDLLRKRKIDKRLIETVFRWLKTKSTTAFDTNVLQVLYNLTVESESVLRRRALFHESEDLAEYVRKKAKDVYTKIDKKAEELSTTSEKTEFGTPFRKVIKERKKVPR